MITLKERYIGALLGLAISDALGMGTDWMTKEEISAQYCRVNSFISRRLPAGSYTDDTQQTCILLKSLLANGGLNIESYRRKMIQETDPNRGLGPSLGHFLKTGKPRERAVPSNGLAMKIAAVPLFSHGKPQEITNLVETIGSLTHTHPSSIGGAIGIAWATQYALEGRGREFFYTDVLEKVASYDATLARCIDEGIEFQQGTCNVYATVTRALDVFKRSNSFEVGIIEIINNGGDTDTIGAMFGAIAGAYWGINAIPKRWQEGVEDQNQLVKLAVRAYSHNNQRGAKK